MGDPPRTGSCTPTRRHQAPFLSQAELTKSKLSFSAGIPIPWKGVGNGSVSHRAGLGIAGAAAA